MQSSSRVFDSANDAYANYAIERLEVCIIALHALKENLQEAAGDGNLVIRMYLQDITEMLSIRRTFTKFRLTMLNLLD